MDCLSFRWWIKSIQFTGGDEVTLQPASMLILIGPNQGGKSTGLQDLQELSPLAGSPRIVVAKVDVQKEGTADDLLTWFRLHHHHRIVESEEQFFVRGGILRSPALGGWWDSNAWAVFAPHFIHRLDTATRLHLVNPQSSIAIFRDAPQAYIHQLQIDPALHLVVSREVRDSFGESLVIDWTGGPQVRFRIGQQPTEAPSLSREYGRAARQATHSGIPR
jgi:hypothetical protein